MYNKIITSGSYSEFQHKLDQFMDELDKYYYPKIAIWTLHGSTVSVSDNGRMFYAHFTYLNPAKHYPALPFDQSKKPK